MNRKTGFKILMFLLLCLLFLGMRTETAEANWAACYKNETPIPMKNGTVDYERIRKEILIPNRIAEELNGKKLNITILYHRHYVIYGSPFGTKDGKTTCGDDAYRYMGYSESGVAVSDHEFRSDFEAVDEKTKNSQWLRYPWANADVLDKYNNYTTTMPEPKKDTLYTSDAARAADLDRALDIYEPHLNNGRGRFVERQYYWCQNADGSWMQRNIDQSRCGTNGNPPGIYLTGENLVKFAVIHTKASRFHPGNFTMYSQTVKGSAYCGAKNICYATYMIPPLEDMFETKHDALIELTLDKTVLKNEDLTGKMTIRNSWDAKAPLTIEAPCDNTKTQGKAQCANTGRNGGIMITSEDGTTFKQSKIFTFDPINQRNSKDIALDVGDIMPTKAGKYLISTWIQEYADHAGVKEKNVNNNYAKKTFELVAAEENASVEIRGSTYYSMADKLSNEITVNNSMLSPISGEATVSLLDGEGNTVKTLGSFPYSNLGVPGKISFNLSKLDVSLEAGRYIIEAKIPHYQGEGTYVDNTAQIPITVGLFVPENTKCKSITTEFVNILPYNGKKPGITRSCIGWTPNFPSTRVEGGQGTYFYFAYRIFPTPMPAYNVSTMDDLGLYQSFELSEPTTSLGACDFRKDDTACKLYEPFLYYPAKWENQFGSDASLADFKGPYTVGPHEYYHYRYRGRMLPQQITFHYDIVDMEGNKSRIPLAFGDIVYDVPDECYYEDVIDIKEDCRAIEFYVPVEDVSKRTLPADSSAKKVPKERIRFYNPGEHTFRVEVDEKQVYLYQTDEGAEWQGKENVFRKRWNDEPIKEIITEPTTKEVTIYRYDEGTYENKRWCAGHDTCWHADNVYMPKAPDVAYNYNKDGFVGPLYEVQKSMKFVPSPEIKNNNPAFKDRSISAGLDGRPGYAYFNRGLFQLKDGTIKKSNWQPQYIDGSKNYNAEFYKGMPSDAKYLGYEWQRYQIVSGTVTKQGNTPNNKTTPAFNAQEYSIGPIKTHTLKNLPSGEIQWVNQDEYKNHCYSEEDAFSNYGEWDKANAKFKEKDSPAIVCFHNHSDDFHYWKFDWSKVKKFGVGLKDPFGEDKDKPREGRYNGLLFP